MWRRESSEEQGYRVFMFLYLLINLKPNDENELNETHGGTSRAGQAIVSTCSLNTAKEMYCQHGTEEKLGQKFS